MKKLTALRAFDPSKLIVAHVGPAAKPAPAPVAAPVPAWKRILAKRAAQNDPKLSAVVSVTAEDASKLCGPEPFWSDGKGAPTAVIAEPYDPAVNPKALASLVNDTYPLRFDNDGTLYGDRYQNGVKPGWKKLGQLRECLQLQKTPGIGAQESVDDPLVHVKLFDPCGDSTWFITEFNGEDEAFGLCYIHVGELGYINLPEIANVKGGMGIGIEVDMHWKPRRLSEARQELSRKVGGDGVMEHPPAAERVEYVENPPDAKAVALLTDICAKHPTKPGEFAVSDREIADRLVAAMIEDEPATNLGTPSPLSMAALCREEQEMGERLRAGIAKEEAQHKASGRITVSINREHRGVEITFPGKPDAQVREQLKRHHFKWHGAKKVWYRGATRESIAIAANIALGTAEERAALLAAFEALPPKVNVTRFSGGATIRRNANGRCEDAPCCGCCD